MEMITITTEYIKLQDLLKLAAVTATGGEAKLLIQDGEVLVNGEVWHHAGKEAPPRRRGGDPGAALRRAVCRLTACCWKASAITTASS